MSEASAPHRSIKEIIEAAGGPAAISEASGGTIKIDAIYKWPKIGIIDRHWPIVMPLASASTEEMFAANLAAREAAGAAA